MGNNVFDQHFDWAQFNDLGSAPPLMEAARVVDALSLFPGYVAKDSGAVSAYTQTFLRGPKTYVSLPRNRRPAHWAGKYTKKVVPLVPAKMVLPALVKRGYLTLTQGGAVCTTAQDMPALVKKTVLPALVKMDTPACARVHLKCSIPSYQKGNTHGFPPW